MPSLADALDRLTAPATLVEPLPDGDVRCLACGHRCLIRAGPARHLPGALQPRRRAARPLGLRRRPAVRPDREEALLPRAARIRCADLRHAGLRLPLRLLPELGHLAGPARPGQPMPPSRLFRPVTPEAVVDARRCAAGRRWSPRPTTSRSSPPSGRVEHLPTAKARPGCAAPSSPTATPPPRCSSLPAPLPDGLQDRPEDDAGRQPTASWAACCNTCWTRSAALTSWAGGWRW